MAIKLGEFNPCPKPIHSRKTPKRVDRGKFSPKTIKEIFERDGNRCVRCGSYRSESVPHHCKFKSAGGLGTKKNGATICLDCHREAHTKREVRQWFEEWSENCLDENGNRL